MAAPKRQLAKYWGRERGPCGPTSDAYESIHKMKKIYQMYNNKKT